MEVDAVIVDGLVAPYIVGSFENYCSCTVKDTSDAAEVVGEGNVQGERAASLAYCHDATIKITDGLGPQRSTLFLVVAQIDSGKNLAAPCKNTFPSLPVRTARDQGDRSLIRI